MKYLPILALSLLTLTGCTKVPAGYEGVKVYLLGSEKGVDTETLGVGRYYIGVNEELFIFPVFKQNVVWTRSSTEGSPVDESITFQTKQGLAINADIGMTYRVNAGHTASVFQEYRKGLDEVTDVVIRNSVRNALVTAAATKAVESVYGPGKIALLKEAHELVRKEFEPHISIEKLYWVGELRLPSIITDAVALKIKSTQKALQRENEIKETIAEAKKRVEKANGLAKARLIEATAEAKAIALVAAALADNPSLVELEAIKKWDGKLPSVSSGAVPFLNLAPKTN